MKSKAGHIDSGRAFGLNRENTLRPASWRFLMLLLSSCSVSPLLAQGPPEIAVAQPLAGIPAAAPVKAVQPVAPPAAPSSHVRFWDRKNILLAGAMAAATAADFAATQRNLSGPGGGREHNPVARVFTGSTAGRVTYFAGSAAGSLGLSYLFHRTHHHKLERATLIIGIGCSAQGAAYSFTH